MFDVLPIPAFQDNYIWLLHNGKHAAVVDPGDDYPVVQALHDLDLMLDGILITHHHDDHIGGVAKLLEKWPVPVYAPRHASYLFPHTIVEEGTRVLLPTLDTQFSVLAIPGHTLEHVAYYGANCLFCGDTLFGAGCGRLFEGTPSQMFASLQRLANLPPETHVYCGHEYTEHNLGFARSLDPNNDKLIARQQDTIEKRRKGEPTLPSTIGLELETNPFLRCSSAPFQAVSGIQNPDPVQVFAAIRIKRNNY